MEGRRRSRRLEGTKPEFDSLPPRGWTRKVVVVKGADSVKEDDDVSNPPSSHTQYVPSSHAKCSSWLMQFPEEEENKSNSSTKKSRASYFRHVLEFKAKAMEEQHELEAEIARKKLDFELLELKNKQERVKLKQELEMVRIEDERANSQYLGSEGEDEERMDLFSQHSELEAKKNKVKERVSRRTSSSAAAVPNSSQKSHTSTGSSVADKSESVISSVLDTNPGQSSKQQLPQQSRMIPFSAEQLSLIFGAQDIARSSDRARDTGGGEIKKFVARQSGVTTLPDFYGDPTKWPMFISHFRGTTTACGYTDFDNICRLRKSLKGKALEAVEDLLNHEDRLADIILTLEENFGQPEEIIRSLVSKSKKMSNVKEDKPDSIIDFANALKNLVATMESLKKTGHMNNPSLMEELVEKLPVSFKTRWGERLAEIEGDVTLKDFSEWMSKRAKAARLLRSTTTRVDPKPREGEKKKPEDNKRRGQPKDLVLALSVATEEKEEAPIKCCEFCGLKNHDTPVCRKFRKLTLDEKWKWTEDNRICYACLFGGHTISECDDKKKCGKDDCKSFHHLLLHRKKTAVKPEVASQKKEEKVDVPQQLAHTTLSQEITNPVLLRILPVTLAGPKGEINIYALLDDASTVTLLDSKVADTIGLDGPRKGLHISFANALTAKDPQSKSLTVKIRGVKEKIWCEMKNVRSSADLRLLPQTVNMEKLSRKWKHLKDLPIDSVTAAVPLMLIGEDQCKFIVTRQYREGPLNSPMASYTKLGWVVHGPSGINNLKDTNAFTYHVRHKDEDLYKLVKDSYSTESFGVKVVQNLPKSANETRALDIVEKTTRRIGERWETGLLWGKEDISLPASKSNALNRLRTMERKMDRNPEFGKLYIAKIEEYVTKGFVRKLSEVEAKQINPRTWYLPHFAVFNPNKPGKVRLVFDAAAKSNGVSLNDVLLTGPDLLTSLPGVLARFRQGQIGFSGDIRDMFHKVAVRKEDQCAQRFLWRGSDRDREPDVYEMLVMTFGATCSPSLAQIVKNKNAMEFEDEFPEAAKAIVHRHYVDDYLDGANTKNEAVKRMQEVREVHRRGGFEIVNWSCSSADALKEICKDTPEAETKTKNLSLEGQLPAERILGLHWDPNKDELYFACKFQKIQDELVNGQKRPTKREVLKVFMSLFDPLGFLSPYIVKARILFQQIWRSGIGWDDELTDIQVVKWRSWLYEMKRIPKIRIPRCYSKLLPDADVIQLHIFVDASEEAFSAAAYLRIGCGKTVDIALVMARSRVAPLKPMTIPKLELQAALMGSRLCVTLLKELELEIQSTHFWSDSRTVLCWLRSDARTYKPFVACRVGEILETTNLDSWHWVPTKLNVADEATRISSQSDFSSTSRWLVGPEFLKLAESEWPVEKVQLEEEEPEPPSEYEETEVVNLTVAVESSLPDVVKFSSWIKLVRVTGWMLRFVNNCKKKKTFGELKPRELAAAERKLVQQSQVESFPEELAALNNSKDLPKRSRLLRLSPVLDEEGLIRLKGRNVNSPDLSESTKRPAILDPKHPLTRLLIMYHHKLAGHSGRDYVLNQIRSKYWILNGRAAVDSVWRSCQLCKVNKAKPLFPEMAPLPAVRVTRPSRPFTVVGVDYFGPMEVTIGRRHEKRYDVLFTCLSVRAVHLEIAASLSTDSAIMAIRRFIGRRGCPEKLYSDNGTNFHGAERELKEALAELDQQKIASTLSAKGIEWHFIPPSGPHFGGSWERLVRSVKISLKANLNERALKEEILQTLFVEAENVVNGRPLTHLSVDPEDLDCLTPNHFLLGNSGGAPLAGDFTEDLCSRKQWRVSQALANQFWRRWVREYLPSLTRRTKWHFPVKPIEIGDLVLIADGNLPRNTWPRGIVTQIYPGGDGVIRSVDIKTSTGVLRRPVVKVCVLDVGRENSSTMEAQPNEKNGNRPGSSTGGSVAPPPDKGGKMSASEQKKKGDKSKQPAESGGRNQCAVKKASESNVALAE